jgi:hypothetical protein
MPAGAVVGDVSKQVYCAFCHAPKYYYVDEKRTCAQCGVHFVFSATEQKHWYETLQFHFDSTAIRCVKCRRQKRYERGAQMRLAEAGQRRKENPNDPGALLEFAESITELRRIGGQGDLAAAIAACRKARRVSAEMILAWYWEGVAHELAG